MFDFCSVQYFRQIKNMRVRFLTREHFLHHYIDKTLKTWNKNMEHFETPKIS